MKRIALMLLGLAVVGHSYAFPTANYLPLHPGNSWTYQKDSTLTYTDTVLPGTVTVNGISAVAIQDSSDNSISYMTNDANGIREIGSFTPSVFITGYGTTSETIVLNPPFIH